MLNKMQEDIYHNGYIFNIKNRFCSLYFRRKKYVCCWGKQISLKSVFSYAKLNFKSLLFSCVRSIWKQSLIIRRLLKFQASLTVATTLSLTLKGEIQPLVSCVEMQLLKVFTVFKFYNNNFMYLIANHILPPSCNSIQGLVTEHQA